MSNEACPGCGKLRGALWVTYNGEIYNFRELREELQARGHRFRSQTDTEVLLHLYAQEGEALVHRLLGMFAFALYDETRARLFLARDRLGIKPLYTAERNGRFLFASEIKALLATGEIPPAVDWQAILDYFTFLFIPAPATAFQDIRQLPPAHLLLYDLAQRRAYLQRYWTPWQHPLRRPPSYPQLQDELRELLTDAVRSELVSDVPLGVFFSGGIDSTLLTALMSRFCSEPIKTFTVIFQGPGLEAHTDLPYARAASRALGTEHHELPVELNRPQELLEMVQLTDQPFGNPTLYLQYLIAKATRSQATVALSGVGGDELFGGYPKYRLIPMAPWLGGVPRGVGRILHRILSAVREDTWVPLLRRAKRLLRGVGWPLSEQYLRWSYSFDEEEKRHLLRGLWEGGEYLPSVRVVEEAMAIAPEGTDRYGRVFAAELATFLAGNLLEYTDKATMAVALETRVPYLDHRLVEFSAQIPFHAKIHGGQSKRIVMDTFRDLLPQEIAQAPKRGFSPPIAKWVDHVLDRCFEEELTPHRIKRDGIFCWEAIEQLRQARRCGLRDTSMELVGILMFDAWYRRYIAKDVPAAWASKA
jgi:asparagine synthase (glutamine-hydrolysing)